MHDNVYIIQLKSKEMKVDTLVWFKILQNQMIIAAQNMKVAWIQSIYYKDISFIMLNKSLGLSQNIQCVVK